MIDLRKIAIIFVIAILYAIFVTTFIDAVYERPKYQDFCEEQSIRPVRIGISEGVTCPTIQEPTEEESKACREQKGIIEYKYGANGCATSFKCETCKKFYDEAREKHSFVSFILSSILALLAVAVGLYLPTRKNPLHEWVGTGFILGGLIALFIGTARYFGDLNRVVRPIIILVELLIVIYISYKQLKK